MCKKVMFLGCMMGVLLVPLTQGATSYTGGVQGDWFDSGNWDAGVPMTGVDGGCGLADGRGPLINGGAGVIRDFKIGTSATGTDSKLYLENGSLTVERVIEMGSAANSKGTIQMSDGTLSVPNNHMRIGPYGTGKFIMDGGIVDTVLWFKIGLAGGSGGTDEGGSGYLELNGGEFHTSSIWLNTDPDQATINITNGKLILSGNRTTAVANWITAENIVAFDGDPLGIVRYEYDGSETVVWAEMLDCLPGWSQVDFDEDCDVDLDDLSVVLDEWLDARGPSTPWDVDFSTDIVDANEFYLNPDQRYEDTEYNLTDEPGMMHITTSPSEFNSVDWSNVFNDDVNILLKAKAEDSWGVALWHDLTTDHESDKRYVCFIRIMLDPDLNYQVVELMKGTVNWTIFNEEDTSGNQANQYGQEAVYITGLAPNSIVTVTVNY